MRCKPHDEAFSMYCLRKIKDYDVFWEFCLGVFDEKASEISVKRPIWWSQIDFLKTSYCSIPLPKAFNFVE